MDWSLLLKTFGAVFIAELGDKTQVATFCFAAGGRSFWAVFLGSTLALTATSLLACLLGSALTRVLPVRWVHLASGVLFVVLGAFIIIRNLRG
jgi:putative Ca2+/H+ antiporter (TMEM165/GDT1 family)